MPLRQRPKSVKLSKKQEKGVGLSHAKWITFSYLNSMGRIMCMKSNALLYLGKIWKLFCLHGWKYLLANLLFIFACELRTTFTSLQVVDSKAISWWWHPRLFNQRKCIKLVLSRWLSPITFLNRSTHSRLRNNKSIFWHLCFSPELACLLLFLPHFFTCVCIWKLCGTHMSAPAEYQNKSKSWSNYPI